MRFYYIIYLEKHDQEHIYNRSIPLEIYIQDSDDTQQITKQLKYYLLMIA